LDLQRRYSWREPLKASAYDRGAEDGHYIPRQDQQDDRTTMLVRCGTGGGLRLRSFSSATVGDALFPDKQPDAIWTSLGFRAFHQISSNPDDKPLSTTRLRIVQ
jgi:hypothetical protein